jgi:predicted DsbA family dithiol-disulfide isomerase
MRIEVWSDLVCPWCYVGKRRFETALAGFAHRDEVEVVYRSFQLDPAAPAAPRDQGAVLRAKYGLTAAQAEALEARMQRTASAEGLAFDRAGGLTGNTFDAHRLLHLARRRGLQGAVLERLFRAHFSERRSLFDRDSLVGLAAEAGLDPEEAARVLEDGSFADAVTADREQAAALGANGVPFYVVDGRYGISGAQPPEVFTAALERAWADAHPSRPAAAPPA